MIRAALALSAGIVVPVYAAPPSPQATPELTRQLNAIADQHAVMLRQIGQLQQATQDLEKRLDIHRTQLDAMHPALESDRITKLEDFVAAHEEADREEHAATLRRWNELMSWLKVAASVIGGLALNEVWKRLRAPKLAKRRDAVLNGHLDVIRDTVTELQKTTNGNLDRLVAAARGESLAEGRAQGIRQERDDPHAGPPQTTT